MTHKFFITALILWPVIGAVITYLIGRIDRNFRDYVADLICAVQFALAIRCYKFIGLEMHVSGISGFGMSFKIDEFRFLYVLIIAFMWLATTIFSREYLNHHKNRNRYYFYVLMTLSAITGVFLSNDLMTTFIFFELMSLFSYIMVIQDETPKALKAAETYLYIAVIGGLTSLTGLIILYSITGTFNFTSLINPKVQNMQTLYVAGVLIFSGFAAKAAIFPAHIWLPTAHTAAPAPSSALLSGLLTKSGLFGILILSSNIFMHDKKWGLMLLILALITMVLGAVLAIFSVNLKRTLACSSMSQLGFILTGIAMTCYLGSHNDLAVRGTVLYMVGHSLVKLVLFLCAGVVYFNTHKLELNDIRGFGRGKKVLMFAFIMGGLGLAGFPFWNGYLGKTLIHESIVEYIGMAGNDFDVNLFEIVEWLFLISGGLTIAYVLKLFAVLFIARPVENANTEHQHKKYLSFENVITLLISALMLPLIGLMPYKIGNIIGFAGTNFMNGSTHHIAINYFSFENFKGAIISLIIGIVVYIFVVRRFFMNASKNYYCPDLWPAKLNIEYAIFRPILTIILPFMGALFARIIDVISASWIDAILNSPSKMKFIIPPEDYEFGIYSSIPEHETAGSILSASLSYGLITIVIGVLFVMAFVLI